MKKYLKNILSVFLLVTISSVLWAKIPEKPNPPRLVNDMVGVLNGAEKTDLERRLVAFNDSTGTQILIVIVDDLHGYDPASFTFELGEKWGVGQKGFDNGIVIMVKPVGKANDRHAFIATGYGLEGIVPDLTAKRIVENEMIPHFRNENYFKGLYAATNVLMGLAAQEFTAADYDKNKPGSAIGLLPVLLILIIAFKLASWNTRAKNQSYTGGHKGTLMQDILIARGMSNMHRGKYGSFSSGGGSFGGGGFGGFGGGGFGGGGAGGSW